VKIHAFDYPFDTPGSATENPSNIRINLILPETRVIGLHLRRWKCSSIFIQIFTVSSERRITCFETDCIGLLTLQGHPRSLILAPIESAYGTPIGPQ